MDHLNKAPRGLRGWARKIASRLTGSVIASRPAEVRPVAAQPAPEPDLEHAPEPLPPAAYEPVAPVAPEPVLEAVTMSTQGPAETMAEPLPPPLPTTTPEPPAPAPSPATLASEAKAAAARREWPTALELWSEIAALNPKDRAAVIGMVAALRGLDRQQEAEAVLLEAAPRFPKDTWFLATYARIAQQRRDWDTALARWQDLRARFPDAAVGYAGMGSTLREAKRLDEAEAVLAEGAARFPDDVGIMTPWALTAGNRKDWHAALERWTAFDLREPGRVAGDAGIAEALVGLGRLEEAEARLTAAVERHPEHRTIAIRHAEIATRRKDFAAAVLRWHALLQRFPEDRTVRAGADRAAMQQQKRAG